MTTDAWGIDDQYYDAPGNLRVTSPRTRAAIHQAMGVDPAGPAGQGSGVVVVRSGEAFTPPAPGELQLESGERLPIDRARPADLPPGYHDFFAVGAAERRRAAARHRQPRPLPSAGRFAAVGLGRAALLGPQPGELGDRRPGRPGPIGKLGPSAGGRHAGGQSAGSDRSHAATGSKSLLSEQPAVSQSALSFDRRRSPATRR